MAEFRCPYCGRKFTDAVARSQHVRRCPDGPNRRRFLVIGPRALCPSQTRTGAVSVCVSRNVSRETVSTIGPCEPS